MDNINDLDNFLNEKKVVVKRRYTEAYPAKNVSTNARVRSVILDAISDGHITKEEMNRILTELQANKRWLKRNLSLFNISEDQEGVTTYSLSPYGQRVKDRTLPKVLNEALNVPHKERGTKPVNIFVGRFQPFTLGHVKVFEKMYKQNGLPVVVFLVRGGKPDPEKRPFDETLQQAMFTKMAKQYPFLETAIVVPNGAIDTLYAHARPAYEPMMWGFGTDRKKSYNAMITKDRYRQELDVDPSFKGFEIKRTDDNISASKVRNALKIDDEKAFKKMTPKSIHKFYIPLQNILQPIKENKDMKNLKSLNEYTEKVEEGQVLLFDELDDSFDALTTKIRNLIDKTDDPKWQKALNKMLNQAERLTDIAANHDRKLGAIETNESKINEEYIELMRIDDPLDGIKDAWMEWKNGPATERGDIRPAQKELIDYINSWLKKNIK